MATQGNWTFLDHAKLKTFNTVNLATDTMKMALLGSSQSIDHTFLGSSTDARYADLTGELTTANGYTAGGLTLTSETLTRTTTSTTNDTVTWDTADAVWTLTGGITFKYAVIYDNTDTNKSILAFCDMDTGGGTVSPLPGTLTIAIANIMSWK